MMQDEGQKVHGIYYEVKNLQVGTMGTTKNDGSGHELHWHAEEMNSRTQVGLYFIRPDRSVANFTAEVLEREEFFSRFNECSGHNCEFKDKTDEERKQEKVDKQLAIAEEHLEKKEYNAATFEFGQALKQDNKNLKAHLGKGKAHIALGEVDKAKEHFAEMSKNEELFTEDNKHLFNELGIEMRKGGMMADAIANYEKALQIDPDDERLYFNMARAQNESGNKDMALEYLVKAVKMNPEFSEAKAYYQVIKSGA